MPLWEGPQPRCLLRQIPRYRSPCGRGFSPDAPALPVAIALATVPRPRRSAIPARIRTIALPARIPGQVFVSAHARPPTALVGLVARESDLTLVAARIGHAAAATRATRLTELLVVGHGAARITTAGDRTLRRAAVAARELALLVAAAVVARRLRRELVAARVVVELGAVVPAAGSAVRVVAAILAAGAGLVVARIALAAALVG